jgi:hypothetical protein
VAGLRAAGYPTPGWLAAGTTPDGTAYHLQEYATGRPAHPLTADRAALLVEVLERHAGRAPASSAATSPACWPRPSGGCTGWPARWPTRATGAHESTVDRSAGGRRMIRGRRQPVPAKFTRSGTM